MKLCATPGCINTLSEKSKLETCTACRQGLYYWNKKRPAQRLERRRKLRMYDGRLATLVSDAEVEAHIKRKRDE